MVQWVFATVSVACVLPPAHIFFLSKPPFSPSVNALFDYLTGALASLEQEGFSLNHRARVKSTISSFARWLMEEKGLLQRNPTRGVDLPSQHVLAPRQLSEDQRHLLRSATGPVAGSVMSPGCSWPIHMLVQRSGGCMWATR